MNDPMRIRAIPPADHPAQSLARGMEKPINVPKSGRTARIDRTGERYGRLVVRSLDDSRHGRGAHWICECDCGRVKSIRGSKLGCGTTISCGCVGLERRVAAASIAKLKHGESDSRTYKIWSGMRNRCTNEKADQWKWYGGRGVSICERWSKFENFLADMGHAPEGLTIERRDCNGHYEPSNCYWATWEIQRKNKNNPGACKPVSPLRTA